MMILKIGGDNYNRNKPKSVKTEQGLEIIRRKIHTPI